MVVRGIGSRLCLFQGSMQMPCDPTPSGSVAVDIWHWSLDDAFADEAHARALLSADEVVRVARFVRDVDRRRSICARAGLRLVLAGYLNIAPEALRFAYNNWGKPELVDERLSFNLSHSGGEALLAVSRDAELGVDIENIRPLTDALARHFFSAAECRELANLPEHERLPAFYRCWTRKEAFVKGHGAGLSLPLDGFDVSSQETDGHGLLLRLDTSIGLLDDWALLNLDVVDGFCAALAVHAQARVVRVDYRNRLAWSANMASMT